MKQIVAESVKQVISELDWRTYANAYKKARRTETPLHYGRFNNAAADAFNREYAYDGTHYWDDGCYRMYRGYCPDERGWPPSLSIDLHNVVNSNGTYIDGHETFF